MRKSFKISAIIVASLFLIKTTHSSNKSALNVEKFTKKSPNATSYLFKKSSTVFNTNIFNYLNNLKTYYDKLTNLEPQEKITETSPEQSSFVKTILPVVTTTSPWLYYAYKIYKGKNPSILKYTTISVGGGILLGGAFWAKKAIQKKLQDRKAIQKKIQKKNQYNSKKNKLESAFSFESDNLCKLIGTSETWKNSSNSNSNECVMKNLTIKNGLMDLQENISKRITIKKINYDFELLNHYNNQMAQFQFMNKNNLKETKNQLKSFITFNKNRLEMFIKNASNDEEKELT